MGWPMTGPCPRPPASTPYPMSLINDLGFAPALGPCSAPRRPPSGQVARGPPSSVEGKHGAPRRAPTPAEQPQAGSFPRRGEKLSQARGAGALLLVPPAGHGAAAPTELRGGCWERLVPGEYLKGETKGLRCGEATASRSPFLSSLWGGGALS